MGEYGIITSLVAFGGFSFIIGRYRTRYREAALIALKERKAFKNIRRLYCVVLVESTFLIFFLWQISLALAAGKIQPALTLFGFMLLAIMNILKDGSMAFNVSRRLAFRINIRNAIFSVLMYGGLVLVAGWFLYALMSILLLITGQ